MNQPQVPGQPCQQADTEFMQIDLAAGKDRDTGCRVAELFRKRFVICIDADTDQQVAFPAGELGDVLQIISFGQ